MGMHVLKVNGVAFHVCTRAQMYEALPKLGDMDNMFHELVTPDDVPSAYVYMPPVTLEKVAQASGLETSKLDYAVPQSYFDSPDVKERRDRGDRPMWYYGDNPAGEPVWYSGLWSIVLDKLAERWTEINTIKTV
jgi:hypothetical protein